MEFSASFGSFRGQRLERHVALLSAEQELSSATCWVLELLGSSARSFETAEELLAASTEAAFDLAMCDLDLALPLLQSSDGSLPFSVVLMCPKRMDKRLLSTCIEKGAKAYVSKPLRVQAIRGVLLRYAQQEEETPSPTASCKGKGNYERVRSLGSGSCGEVSLVRRCRDGRCFALKEVPIGYLGAAEQRRVLEELRLHKAFDCPCVVRYFTSWMQDDTACLLLEYVENGSLAAEVQRCRREERQISDACIIDWASQILLGLLYLHRKEVVHRDLKTENLLGPSLDGCVKIADFGISKRLGGAALARSLVGTLEVMAPERVQALHEGVGASPSEYGPESDLWSLGVVLYELAVLRAPFSEDRPDLSAQERQQRLIDRIRHEKPTPLPFSRAAVLHKVVIGGLLQKQPSQRPSAADLCRDPDLGRSIQHFLQKQRLLDHPSILEILDVLPNIDPEGSFIGSDLDVVTLRSHRSSLNGSLDGPFLDGARLSASELRKLLPEDLAEVFEPVEVKNATLDVPSEPAEPRRRKASKRMEASTAATVASVLPQRAASHAGVLGPVASPSDQTSQSLSSTTSTASSPRPPPFPRPIPPRPSLGPDLAWPESMRGANRRALANLKRSDSNQGEDSRLPGALDRNSVSSASSLPDLHQVVWSGTRGELPLSRRGSGSKLEPLETTPKVRANSEDLTAELVGSPAGPALPGVRARGTRCFTPQAMSRIRLPPSMEVERCQSTPAIPGRCVKRLADACTDANTLSEPKV